MKNALIFTYSRSYNFGANLQGYSLQRFIKSLGYGCKVIDIRTEAQIANRIPYRKDPKGLLLNAFTILHRCTLMRGRARFNEYHYEPDERVKLPLIDGEPDLDALGGEQPKADVYVTGSDQVFSPSLLSDLYFLNFNTQDVPCISYAASVGVDNIPEKLQPVIAGFLKKYRRISVREEQACRAVQPLVEQTVEIHVDPVVLTPREIWEQEESAYQSLEGKQYILAYFLYRPGGMNQYLKELHKKTGLPVVLVDTNAFRNIYHQKLVLDAGPREFLWLLHNAQMVVTSSFHGTVFSMIYGKDFAVFNNPAATARINHVLQLFGTEKHQLVEGCAADPQDLRLSEFERCRIAQTIFRETERSKQYLLDSIEG